MSQSRPSTKLNPLFAGATLRCWLSMLGTAGVTRATGSTIAKTCLMVAALTPLRLYEALVTRRAIARTEVKQAPVFIIGFFRSGTTHLHNVLSQHAGFGFLNAVEAALYPCAHMIATPGNPLHRGLRSFSAKRPMDNLVYSTALPQEEEYALAAYYPRTFAPAFTFAHRLGHYIDTALSPADMDPAEQQRWKAAFHRMIQKATWLRGGKRLLLKNPPNTARIRWLLELYPDAKFIHIRRNPYEVFPSVVHLFTSMWKAYDVEGDRAVLEEEALRLYTKVMTAYFEQQALIPAGNLVEVSYEAFSAAPLQEAIRLFEALGVPCGNEDVKAMEAYLSTQTNFEKNKFDYDAAMAERVHQAWAFTIDRWGYQPPGVRPAAIAEPGGG